MIRREAHKGTNEVKVTFTITIDGIEGSVAVVGDFNRLGPHRHSQ